MISRMDRHQRWSRGGLETGTVLSDETVEVDVTEEVRRDAIVSRARQAIGRLQQIEAQAAKRTDAANLGQANAQLQGLADAVSDLSRMVRYVLIADVVPGLLADVDAAGDLGQ